MASSTPQNPIIRVLAFLTKYSTGLKILGGIVAAFFSVYVYFNGLNSFATDNKNNSNSSNSETKIKCLNKSKSADWYNNTNNSASSIYRKPLEDAIRACKKANNTERQANSQYLLGLLEASLSNYPEAKSAFNKAGSLYSDTGDSKWAQYSFDAAANPEAPPHSSLRPPTN